MPAFPLSTLWRQLLAYHSMDMWKTLRHSNRSKHYASISTSNRGHRIPDQRNLWFCYSNYAQGWLFKSGQLIVFSYTFVRTIYYRGDALIQTRLYWQMSQQMPTVYSWRADKLDYLRMVLYSKIVTCKYFSRHWQYADARTFSQNRNIFLTGGDTL